MNHSVYLLPAPWLSISRSALRWLLRKEVDPLTLLSRNRQGDWGEVTRRDGQQNDASLKDANALLALYGDGGEGLILLTEANHLFAHMMTEHEHLSMLSAGHLEGNDDPRNEQNVRDGELSSTAVMVTPGAVHALGEGGYQFLERLRFHLSTVPIGTCPSNWAQGCAVLAKSLTATVHRTRFGRAVWIITEGDSSTTTVLLPEEY